MARTTSLGHFRGEPTLFDGKYSFFVGTFSTLVTTRTVAEDASPLTVSFCFPITPAPVPVGLAAAPAPLPLTAVAVAPDTANRKWQSHVYQTDLNFLLYMYVSLLMTFYKLMRCQISFQVAVATAPLIPHVQLRFAYITFFAKTSESSQGHSSSANITNSYDFRPRLQLRDYHEKAVQIKIPPKVSCFPVSAAAASSNQLTQSQNRVVMVD